MGWTYTTKPEGESAKAFLDARFTSGPTQSGEWSILASAMKGRTYYAACRFTKADNSDTFVFAVVALVDTKAHRDGYNIGWKDMDETMGPCESECPARILDMLTPTESECAIAWRARCRAALAKRKPKAGEVVTFAEPLKFTNGETMARFRYLRGSRFAPLDAARCGVYCITRWQAKDYSVGEGA